MRRTSNAARIQHRVLEQRARGRQDRSNHDDRAAVLLPSRESEREVSEQTGREWVEDFTCCHWLKVQEGWRLGEEGASLALAVAVAVAVDEVAAQGRYRLRATAAAAYCCTTSTTTAATVTYRTAATSLPV